MNDKLYTALNIATIRALVGTYKSKPAIFSALVMPADCTVSNTINFYRTGPVNLGDEPPLYLYTINCRASTQIASQAMAEAVAQQLHRRYCAGFYSTCRILATIPPMDAADTFNTPVASVLKPL